jgi:hypothetical protein
MPSYSPSQGLPLAVPPMLPPNLRRHIESVCGERHPLKRLSEEKLTPAAHKSMDIPNSTAATTSTDGPHGIAVCSEHGLHASDVSMMGCEQLPASTDDVSGHPAEEEEEPQQEEDPPGLVFQSISPAETLQLLLRVAMYKIRTNQIHVSFAELQIEQDHENGGGNGTAANPLSSTTEDTIIDDATPEGSRLVADDLSEDADDLPLSSRTPLVNSDETRAVLERLVQDLQSLDGDTEDDLSPASEDDSEGYHGTPLSSGHDSEPEDASDGHRSHPQGNQAGSQEAPGSSSLGNRTNGQDSGELGRKRQRTGNSNSDDNGNGNGNEDPAHVRVHKNQKVSSLDNAQPFMCCHRDEPDFHGKMCPGTDQSIGEVISSQGKFHRKYVCSKCFLLLEVVSNKKRHPNGVECVEHCLSPRCYRASATAVYPRHPFNPELCGSKTNRSRPEDRESDFRYIFGLLHFDKESPANVFAAKKGPHTSQKTRNRKSDKDELILRAQEILEGYDKRQELESAKAEIEELRRDGEMKQTTYTSLEAEVRNLEEKAKRLEEKAKRLEEKAKRFEEKVRRVQGIVADVVQPRVLEDEHWYRCIRRQVEIDAPEALKGFPPPPRTLQTPPGSLRGSQGPSTMPTPNGAGTAAQYQTSQDDRWQHPSNDAASSPSSKSLGKRPARDHMPESNLVGPTFPDNAHNYNISKYTTTVIPPEMVMNADPVNAMPEFVVGPDERWYQDTLSGNVDFPNSQLDPYEGNHLPDPLPDQVWTENYSNGGPPIYDAGSGTMQWFPAGQS